MPQLSLNKEALTASARRLSDHLQTRHALAVQHTQAMDALAAAMGYRNRQELCAAAKSEPEAANSTPAARPQTPQSVPVYIITIDHRHGTDTLVGASEDEVKQQLAEYVEENWSEYEDILSEAAEDPEDMGPHEAIDAYFAVVEDESYWMSTHTLQIPAASAPSGPTAQSPAPPFKNGRSQLLKLQLDQQIAQLTGPWSETDRVRACEQGYRLEEADPRIPGMPGRIRIVADPAPDVGEVRHDTDRDADLHVRRRAGEGDATALKALRLSQGFDLEDQSEPGHPVEIYVCDSCDFTAPHEAMEPAKRIAERAAPGETYTDCECPLCGSLAFPDES